jgi:hypothetical protein
MTTARLPRTIAKDVGQCIAIRARWLRNGVAQIPTAARFTARIKRGGTLYEISEADGLTIDAVDGWVTGEVPGSVTQDWTAGKEVEFQLDGYYDTECPFRLDKGRYLMRYHPKYGT